MRTNEITTIFVDKELNLGQVFQLTGVGPVSVDSSTSIKLQSKNQRLVYNVSRTLQTLGLNVIDIKG